MRLKTPSRYVSCARAAKYNALTLLVVALFTWFSTLPPAPRPLVRVSAAEQAPDSQRNSSQQQRGQGNTNPIAEDYPSQPLQEDLHHTRGTTRPRATVPILPWSRELLLSDLWGGRTAAFSANPRRSNELARPNAPPLFLLHLNLRA